MVFRLYIGNIPFSTQPEELVSFFSDNGFIVRNPKIPMNRETGRPRGFAFVDVESQTDQEAAIRTLDGTPFGGREMRVSLAVERERSTNRNQTASKEEDFSRQNDRSNGHRRPSLHRATGDYDDVW